MSPFLMRPLYRVYSFGWQEILSHLPSPINTDEKRGKHRVGKKEKQSLRFFSGQGGEAGLRLGPVSFSSHLPGNSWPSFKPSLSYFGHNAFEVHGGTRQPLDLNTRENVTVTCTPPLSCICHAQTPALNSILLLPTLFLPCTWLISCTILLGSIWHL